MSAHKSRRYGDWAGNPGGYPENPERCIWAVYGDFMYSHQCNRKRGYGPEGLYCRQHAKSIEPTIKDRKQFQAALAQAEKTK